MAYSIAGIELQPAGGKGVVQEESVKKEAMLTVTPAYLLDSDETYVFDFGGAQRTINIVGKYTGSLNEIKSFINSLQGLVQGHQDFKAGYPKDYVSDLLGTVKVKIMSFEFTWVAGEPSVVYYNLRLIESSTKV